MKETEASTHTHTEKTTTPYIILQYLRILAFASRRMKLNKEYLESLFFLLISPLYYVIGFEGKLSTPIGYLFIDNKITLRSFTYGFFKTQFSYKHIMSKIFLDVLSHSVVVDVGANIGDFTLGLKDVAEKIIAIEPGAYNFEALESNIKSNKLSNVIPLRLAAHDREESLFLEGNTSDMHIGQGNKGEPVKGMPLDMIMSNLEIKNIDILKIDVQGHERSVLIGANKLFEDKRVKLLIVEAHIHRNVFVKDIVSFMDAKGYSLIYRDEFFLAHQPHLYFMSSDRK